MEACMIFETVEQVYWLYGTFHAFLMQINF